jgi:hypothetical protein
MAVGMSVLIAAFELWTISPSFASFETVDSPTATLFTVLFVYGIWLLAGALDVVCFLVMKGWRNRLIVLGGIFVLIVPLAVMFWIMDS